MTISAKISLDWEKWLHKPSAKLQYKDYTDKFGNVISEVKEIGRRLGGTIEEVTPSKLARVISEGRTWSPYTFNECPHWKRPRRLEHLFEQTSVFALDWDDGKTVEDVKELAEKFGLQFTLLHHSFSSTPAHNKLRAVIFTEEQITDLYQAKQVSIALANLFEADRQCVDAARLFFGSTSESVIEVNQFIAPNSLLYSLTEKVDTKSQLDYLSQEGSIEKDADVAWGDSETQRKIFASLPSRKLKYAKMKVLGILNDIEEFNGEGKSRYEMVWKSTSRLARMPELVGSAVYVWVKDSIKKNNYFDDWEHDPEEVIKSAIEWSNGHSDEPI